MTHPQLGRRFLVSTLFARTPRFFGASESSSCPGRTGIITYCATKREDEGRISGTRTRSS
jgi:hypothetical protein